jgi:hypothetical protein
MTTEQKKEGMRPLTMQVLRDAGSPAALEPNKHIIPPL